jgi:glucose/arabinose dehydrogenase
MMTPKSHRGIASASIVVLLVFLVTITTSIHCQERYTARIVASGLDVPWGMAQAPDGFLWITERAGRILRLDASTGERTTMLSIEDRVWNGAESGMLGIALHPAFPDSPYVYTTYVEPEWPWKQHLSRFTYGGDSLGDEVQLLTLPNSFNSHTGARIVFGLDTTIYFCTGELTEGWYSQDTSKLPGKVLRIHQDGSIPDDNPIPGSPVWAWGLRNPQGMTMLPDGRLFTAEHGPANDDEVNLIVKGGNYGWPNVEGRAKTDEERAFKDSTGAIDAFWTTGRSSYGLSPLAYYSGSRFPQWNRSLLVGSLKDATITVLKIDRDSDTALSFRNYFAHAFGRIRDILVTTDGRILFCTSNRDGRAGFGYPRPSDDHIYELVSLPETAIPLFDEQPVPDTVFATVGDTIYHTMWLYNSGDAMAEITEFHRHGDYQEAIENWRFNGRSWIAPQIPCPHALRIMPSVERPHTVSMRFVATTPPVERIYSVVVNPSFPDIQFDRDLVEVETPVGSRVAVDLPIRNPSSFEVTITGVVINGLNADEYHVEESQFPMVIPPAGTANVRVWFEPHSLGDGKIAVVVPIGTHRREREIILLGIGTPVSVNNGEPQVKATVFPVPSSAYLTVTLPAPADNFTRISIISAVGQTVVSSDVQAGVSSTSIPVHHLATGTYSLLIHNGTAISRLPIVIQR